MSVSLEGDSASLVYDPDRVAPKEMEQAVQRVILLPGLRRSVERAAHLYHRRKP